MTLYRLSKEKFINDLSGKGAEIAGGRWNSKGNPIVYTSSSRALCTTEIAVHTPLGIIPKNYYLATIEINSPFSLLEVKDSQLSPDWNIFPHPVSTKRIGDEFIKQNKYLLLKVPSAVVPGDFNYLINPRHSEISKVKIVKIESFSFDKRLFQ